MESKNLEQVKDMINRIADYYDLPTEEQTEEIQNLTGVDWDAEDLRMLCCEYWGHNSLEEMVYLMFHGEYPPIHEVKLVFWKYKPGIVMNDKVVYEKYRLGKGKLKALEALPLGKILQKIKDEFFGWKQNTRIVGEKSWRFDCLEQAEYWSDTHFWIFEYGRETEVQREHQMLVFSSHNMCEEQIEIILKCMESFQISLHIREEKVI